MNREEVNLSIYRSSTNSESVNSLLSSLLGGHSECWLVGLLDILSLLDTVELNMAVRGKVWADTTVGTVGSSTSRDSSLNNDVADDALIHVQLLALGICSQVNEELTNDFDGLLWPSSLSVFELFALSVSSNASSELSEWNDASVLEHILHISDSLLQGNSLHRTGNLISVLEVSSKVGNLAFSS